MYVCVWDKGERIRMFMFFFLVYYIFESKVGVFVFGQINDESTPSRPLGEVKLVRARLVVRWVTTCEARVLKTFSFFLFSPFFSLCLPVSPFLFSPRFVSFSLPKILHFLSYCMYKK